MRGRRRFLVTRPKGRSEELCARLRAIGIEPIEVPAISIEPPLSYEDLDRAITELETYDWVLVTSGNAVAAVFERASILGVPLAMPRRQWAAIGPGTAEELRRRGVDHVWIPNRFLSEAAGSELPAVAGDRVLRIRAELASDAPAALLRARGIEVTEVAAYRTVEAPPASRELLRDALDSGVEGVIFTSASTVRGLLRLAQSVERGDGIRRLLIVAIGPVTAAEVEAMGLRAWVVANEHSIDGIVNVLRERGMSHADVTPG